MEEDVATELVGGDRVTEVVDATARLRDLRDVPLPIRSDLLPLLHGHPDEVPVVLEAAHERLDECLLLRVQLAAGIERPAELLGDLDPVVVQEEWVTIPWRSAAASHSSQWSRIASFRPLAGSWSTHGL